MQLGERNNVYSQLNSLSWWEILAQEGLRECFPCDEGIWLLILKPISSSIRKGEWKEPQSNGINVYPIKYDCIALCKEIMKMHVWVLKGCPSN